MKKAFIITVCCLSAIIIGMSVALYFNGTALASSNASLENLYQRSFYELVNNVNDIEVDVSKLMVSNDATSQKKILTSLKQQTTEAQNNLSLLPVDSSTVITTTKFINELNGYCSSLLKYDTEKIADEETENIKTIYEAVAQIKYELNNISYKLMQGYSIVENLNGNSDLSNFSINFSGLGSDSIEYPSMIYDGPFSESLDKKEIKGLGQNEYSREEAEDLIISILDDIVNIEYIGETNGKFETYDFGVNTKGGTNYFVQIAKRDKFVLNINANAIDGDKTIDEKQAIKKAEEFAKKLSLKNMKCVWSATSNNTTYVNLAPVINDVVYYPDLIKLKVDLVADNIIGWEASSYAYNHIDRENTTATISKEEAKEKISSNLKVDDIRLCVVPLDFGGEVLAYEFSGTYNNFRYYMYIDATTGDQVRVLRVIQTDQGELLL